MAIIIGGHLRIDPAKADEFAAAAAEVMEGSRAEAGCHYYVLALDPIEPGKVNVFEKWEDEAAMAAHVQEPHFQAFGAKMGGFGITEAAILKHQIASEGPLFG